MQKGSLNRIVFSFGSLALLLLILTSCSYFIGDTSELVPSPGNVEVLSPPEITSCEATYIRRDCDDEYETICGYFCRRWDYALGCWRWYYCCYRSWKHTDCWGDISIRLTVNDPSDDLDARKSPRVRVFDSEPTPGSNTCLINVSQTDIPITSTDVTGSGPIKTVTVRLRNVNVRFTSTCSKFAATLPLRIVFEDCGEEMASLNECRATVEFSKP